MAARLAGLILLLAATAAPAGYGDAESGRPSSPERGLTVMTNAARCDPQGFRDAYIGIDTIMLAASFSAVDPLYHYPALNVTARAHAEDMAANQGLSHTSSDGTTFLNRVTELYTGWNYIGENVATGAADPLGTVVQLLRDDIWPTDHPAPDSSAGDGHRRNILAPYFTETGAGYAYGPSIQWYHFWCQDLGRRFSPAAGTRIPAGSHFTLTAGAVSFIANYFDPGGGTPRSVSLIINDTPHAMALHLGTASRGTWKFDQPDDGYRARYWFECVDYGGAATRYPATDTLLVHPDADDPPAGTTPRPPAGTAGNALTVHPFPATSLSVITAGSPSMAGRLMLYDNRGNLRASRTITAGDQTVKDLFRGLPAGLYSLCSTAAVRPLSVLLVR